MAFGLGSYLLVGLHRLDLPTVNDRCPPGNFSNTTNLLINSTESISSRKYEVPYDIHLALYSLDKITSNNEQICIIKLKSLK